MNDEVFYAQRFDERYNCFQDEIYRLWYRVVDEGEFSVAYVFEFQEEGQRTRKALLKIVRLILGHEKVDAIAFVGNIDFSLPVLVKVPGKVTPRRFNIVIDVQP